MSVDNLVSLGSRPDTDLDAFCTLTRDKKHKNKSPATSVPKQRPVLTRHFSGSHDDIYTGTRVSKVPDPTEYAVKVSRMVPACLLVTLVYVRNSEIVWQWFLAYVIYFCLLYLCDVDLYCLHFTSMLSLSTYISYFFSPPLPLHYCFFSFSISLSLSHPYLHCSLSPSLTSPSPLPSLLHPFPLLSPLTFPPPLHTLTFCLQVDKSPSISSAIDLVLTDSSKVETVPVQKPKLSQKAWNRLSNRNRRKVNPGGSEGRTGQLKESSPLANDTGTYIYIYVCMWSCDLVM